MNIPTYLSNHDSVNDIDTIINKNVFIFINCINLTEVINLIFQRLYYG